MGWRIGRELRIRHRAAGQTEEPLYERLSRGGVTLVPAATLTGIETAEGRRVGDAMAPRLLHDAIPEGTRAGRRV